MSRRHRATNGSSVAAPLVLILIGALTTVGTMIEQPAVKAACGLALCVAIMVVAWHSTGRFGASTYSAKWAAGLVSLPAALTVSGFFLSLTDIGIRPDSVAPCLLVLLAGAVVSAWLMGERRATTGGMIVRPASVTLAVCAAGALAIGLLVSIASYHRWERSYHFASLAARFDGPDHLVVQVENHNPAASDFRLTIRSSGATRSRVVAKRLHLPAGRTASTGVDWTSTSPALVELSEGNSPTAFRSITVTRATAQS